MELFFSFHIQIILEQALKQDSNMVSVYSQGPRIVENVIKVHKDKFVKEVPQDIINQGLEKHQRIGQAKQHDQ